MPRVLLLGFLIAAASSAAAQPAFPRHFGWWTVDCGPSVLGWDCGVATDLLPIRQWGRPQLLYSRVSGWLVMDVGAKSTSVRVDNGREYSTEDCSQREGRTFCLLPESATGPLLKEAPAGTSLAVTTRYAERLQLTVIPLDRFAAALAYAERIR